jgi:hypothetical protein
MNIFAQKIILNRKIKLIWDFRGPEAQKIAEHHAIHLEEFAVKENLKFHEISTSEISEMYSTAFIIVNETNMLIYRDALKPHRGEVAN